MTEPIDDDKTAEAGPKTREGAEQAAALDSLTDVAQERQLKKADTTQVQQAMAALAAQQRASQEVQRQRERELAAVKVSASDVELIVAEFELDKKKAERRLRECKGDVRLALESLLEA